MEAGKYHSKMFMQILSILFVFVFIKAPANSQTENLQNKIAIENFVKEFNSNNYEAIFSMFSDDMQIQIPKEKSIDLLNGLKNQAGKILSYNFMRYEEVSVALYKVKFEKATFQMSFLIENKKIKSLLLKAFEEEITPTFLRNQTKLILPFKEEWFVFWGGDTREQNYHVDFQSQKNAIDFLIIDKSTGKSFKNDGLTNEDYFAFGKELIAPCDGLVVSVVDGVKDNIPGEKNPFYAGGNSIILKTQNNEYLVFCHFKHQSIKVKENQYIKKGEIIGLCGNSGNSSEAHLHFHIQNSENVNSAKGIKCFFDKLSLYGVLKNDYSPLKGDYIKNIEK